MGRNLPPYSVTGTYTPPGGPLNYPTNFNDFNVIDSPDFLIANSPFPNQSYVLNEFGPTGGFNNNITFNGPLLPVIPTFAEYAPTQTQMDILNDTFIDAAYIQNSYGPIGGFQYMVDITDIQLNNLNYQPYWEPPNFAPSSYSPYEILFSDNPQGNNGPLSQDSFLARLGAEQLKTSFQNRVDAEIYQNTVGLVNLESLQDPFEASLLVTGQEPLIQRNWRITVPENPILRVADFATRLASAYWPVSPIPGSYYDEPSLDTKQTSNALNVTNQLTGGFLGPILNKRRQPSEIFLANTGNGQRSALFKNIKYNTYQPGYDKNFGGLLGIGQGILNLATSLINSDNGTINGGYYVGSKNADPSTITSPPNQVPVNPSGEQLQSPVYGPSELGKLYEGNIDSLNFGLAGKSMTDGGGITGEFVWTSPKYKSNAGFRATPGGGSGSQDEGFSSISSQYTRGESTNLTFKESSILDETQRLVDSADNVTGIARLKHVGNAMNQVSKVFNDGYREITKGSRVLSYVDDADGSQAGIEYCRVFTKDTPYYTYNDLQKTDGIVNTGRRFSNSVLDNTYNLNIAPTEGNVDKNPGGRVKKYMFSIENLAWRTSSRPGFRYDDLPNCEKGPNGGRVMWFPPYDISFSESNTANWNSTSFLGRPEPIYTYKDTTRTGNLKWKIVVDHPSILNLIVDKQLKSVKDKQRVNSMIDSFFAGCLKYDLYELGVRYNTIPSSDLYTYQEILNEVPSEETITEIIKSLPEDAGSSSEQTTPDPSIETFKSKFEGLGFYFDNDIPDPKTTRTTSTVRFDTTYNSYTSDSNISKYVTNADATFNDDVNKNVKQFFDNVVIDNFKTISENSESNFILDAYNILKEKKGRIKVNLVGSASSPNTAEYNLNLSERRVDSVIQYLKFATSGDANLKEFFDDKTIEVNTKFLGEGETIVFPKSSIGSFGSSVNCTEDPIDKNGNKTSFSKVFSVSAMACRRVSIDSIEVIETKPEPVEPEPITTQVERKIQTTKQIKSIQEKLKEGIGKRILRKLLTECDYFEVIKEENPMVYDSIQDKIKYFDPAFHSMTPEGLNSRLTFLNQCLRPGETIPIVRTYKDENGNSVGGDNNVIYNDAVNTSFGTPPVLILRIGDFYNTKIIPKTISFSYDPLSLDLNPEGIGVQPMIAEVNMSFDFIGGQGLKEPVEQLQNALSFNYFGNTEIYDERAVATEDTTAIDKELIQRIKDQESINKFIDENGELPNPVGDTIGTITSTIAVDGGFTGETTYQKLMDGLLTETKNYYEFIPNKIKTFINENNYGVWQLVSSSRKYYEGEFKFGDSDSPELVSIYGMSDKVQEKIDESFNYLTDDINDGVDPIISELKKFNFKNSEIESVKTNMVKYVNDYKVGFSTPIFTKVAEITKQQTDMVQVFRKVNLILDKIDGKRPEKIIPIIYNLTPTNQVDTSDIPLEDTQQVMVSDYYKVSENMNNYINNVLVGDELFIDNSGGSFYDTFGPGSFLTSSDELENLVDQHMFIILSNIFDDKDKLNDFVNKVITDDLSSNKRLKRKFEKVCDDFAKKVRRELREENKMIDKFLKSDKYVKFIKEDPYTHGKTRVFNYSTVVIPDEIENQKSEFNMLFGGSIGNKWTDRTKFN